MALSTYAELQTAIGVLLDKTNLTAAIPDFIRLCEGDVDGREDLAWHRRRICRSRAMVSTEYAMLMTNYMAVQSIEIVPDVPAATTGSELNALDVSAYAAHSLLRVDPDTITRLKNEATDTVTGEPTHYTIVGREMRQWPVPDRGYANLFTVYERLPLLATYDTNWVLEFYPQIYLYGAAKHSAPYLRDDERVSLWEALYEKACQDAARADPNETSRATLSTPDLSAMTSRRTLGWDA